MKRVVTITLLAALLFVGCSRQTKVAEVLHRDFYATTWERFDYVYNDLVLKEETSFDLTLRMGFTNDYPYDDFSMVFTIFDGNGNPYRSKGYKFNLKDDDGNWKSQMKDGSYTFEFPINKQLTITEPGTYRFQIEYRMPITPIVGVKELTLVNN